MFAKKLNWAVVFTSVCLWEICICSSNEMGLKSSKFSVDKPSTDWESLLFRISNGVGTLGQACTHHSQFYCLDSYRTLNPLEQTQNLSEISAVKENPYDKTACAAWFGLLIKDRWIHINMINFYNPKDCCSHQVEHYMQYGFKNKQMSPDEYMFKLTDYHNEDNKPLNYLSAYYIPEVCLNLIMDVGFGPGNLRRDHQSEVIEGTPYVIAGRDLHGIGIPHMLSVIFDYDNPGQNLTFHWFKHHIMCRDNAWICDDPKKNKKGKKSGQKGSDASSSASGSTSSSSQSKKSGSKKSRRKQKNVELRRRLLLDTSDIRTKLYFQNHPLNMCGRF